MVRREEKTRRFGAGPRLAIGSAVLGASGWLLLPPARGPLPPPAAVEVQGPLNAGAARVPLALPSANTLAGYGPRPRASRHASELLYARALAVGPWRLVELDLLEIPRQLWTAVAKRLPPDSFLWLVASHTHSGPGGYDPTLLAELGGARRFDARVFAAAADAAVAAATAAAASARPAHFSAGWQEHPELKTGRRPGAQPDPRLWTLRVEAEGGRLATLIAFGAHPTMVGRSARQLSTDWPGAAAAVEEEGPGGVTLVVQAAGGDSTWNFPAGPPAAQLVAYGRQLAAAAESAEAVPLFPAGDASLSLDRFLAPTHWQPALAPFPMADPVAVQLARLGSLTLVCLPGEVTGAAWREIQASAPALGQALPITLCGDELAYVEGLAQQADGLGEKPRFYPRAVEDLAGALAGHAGSLDPRAARRPGG